MQVTAHVLFLLFILLRCQGYPASTNQLKLITVPQLNVHMQAGMSIGAISNVEEAIDRTAAETKLHAASISSKL